jgi:hypothetical protein
MTAVDISIPKVAFGFTIVMPKTLALMLLLVRKTSTLTYCVKTPVKPYPMTTLSLTSLTPKIPAPATNSASPFKP